MRITNNIKVWLILGATDMRKSMNSLSVLVAEYQGMDVFSGHLFAFCNGDRTIVKALYWDRNGFCLWHKRLERGRFLWPRSEQEIVAMEYRQLQWLLDGLDPLSAKGHPSLHFTNIV